MDHQQWPQDGITAEMISGRPSRCVWMRKRYVLRSDSFPFNASVGAARYVLGAGKGFFFKYVLYIGLMTIGCREMGFFPRYPAPRLA